MIAWTDHTLTNVHQLQTTTLLEMHVMMFTIEIVFFIIVRLTVPIPLTLCMNQSDIIKAGTLKTKTTCIADGV